MSQSYVFSCPQSLKWLEHYLKIAEEHDRRDPVISYYCRLFALESAIKAEKSPEVKDFSLSIMSYLEETKKTGADAIRFMVAGEAHVENYALKLFHHADNLDNNGQYGKNVMKTYYTAGMLFDVLQTFGELSEEIVQKRKYAKWRAAYLFRCIKSGEVPEPSPSGAAGTYGIPEDESVNDFDDSTAQDTHVTPAQPPTISSGNGYNAGPNFTGYSENVQPNSPTNLPAVNPIPTSSHYLPTPVNNNFENIDTGNVTLSAEQMVQAQKFCKWAGSALQFDDIPTAIMNLEKALRLLKTGSVE